jgi:N-acetylneuraminic acid mutarotase
MLVLCERPSSHFLEAQKMSRLKNIFIFAVFALSLIVVSSAAAASWTEVAYLDTARSDHTATLLPDGRVLVTGGQGGEGPLNTAEIFNPATGTWHMTSNMITGRQGQTATLLLDGRVLVVGGEGSDGESLNSAELYDPVSDVWMSAGTMTNARKAHTATLLQDGRVLVAGGEGALNSAEIFNPAGTWTPTGDLTYGRQNHTATLLPNGKVLVAGGYGGFYSTYSLLYDPATGIWSPHADLYTNRFAHTATLTPNGEVLVAGGYGPLASAQLYKTGGYWTDTEALIAARSNHTATLLPDGRILVVGGYGSAGQLNSAELYDPVNYISCFWDRDSLTTARCYHTATLLTDGKVLVAGGETIDQPPNSALNSVEIYDEVMNEWVEKDSLHIGRRNHTATLLTDGKVLVAGGCYYIGPDEYHYFNSAELYDLDQDTWTMTGDMNFARRRHTATLLPDGKVLVVGGEWDNGYLGSAELYDPATGVWIETGDLNTARSHHTATLLPDGKVLVAGGLNGSDMINSSYLSSCELYDPGTGTWSRTFSMNIRRCVHTATLLPDGKVLVAGGINKSSVLPSSINSTEFYDPATGIWMEADSLNNNRCHHTATLLLDGRVFVAGGGSEIYDPTTGKWLNTGGIQNELHHTATLLPDGKVLVAGGKIDSGVTSISGVFYDDHDYDILFPWHPVIDTVTSPLEIGSALQVTGSELRGISEASGGNGVQNSSTNYPLVKLFRVDNEQSRWLQHDPNLNLSDTSFISVPVIDFPDGHAMVTVFTHGKASASGMILVNKPPSVISIIRDDENPTNNSSVTFTVTFSERVTGVDAGDFSLYETGTINGSSVSAVTGSDSVYTVTVNGYSGEGTLRLDVMDNDTIVDMLSLDTPGSPLGGTGLGNGDYATGETYDIDLIAPFLAMAAVQLDGLSVDVTFSETMGSGVTTAANYAISGAGKGTLSTNPVSVVFQNHSTYCLIWNTGEMLDGGDVTITVSDVQDSVGNLIDSPNSATDFGGGIGEAPTTTATPPGGSYNTTKMVSLSCDDGAGSGCASIYYSTDGSPPSTPYTGPLSIDQFTELKFFSQDNAGNTEGFKTEVYYIDIATTITCNLSTDTITFGEPFQVTGQIIPAPNEAGRGVDVAFIPSEGPTVNLATWTDINGSFTLDVGCGGVTKAGTWTVQTSWAGDESHLGDTSDPKELTVNQAGTDLTLDVLMSEAIKVNTRPLIGGNFTPEPYCVDIDLENTEIILHVTEPGGFTVHALKCYTNQYGQYILDYDHAENGGPFDFDAVGDWTIDAEFVGTDEYASAQTSLRTIHVIPTSGYAILIQGRVTSGEGLASHHKTASFVYDKLLARQILPDDIQYFSWVYREGWDGDPSRANIHDAITVWARDKMDPNFVHPDPEQDDQGQPGDLYIVMINHGWTDPVDSEEGLFYIHPDAPLTSTELSAWVSELQDNLAGTVSEDRNIVFILGFCRAGAFIRDLSDLNYPNRVIIASAAKDEASHRGPQDVDENDQPLRDGEYFVTEFFKSVSYGKSITQCFEDATFLTEAFTSSGSGAVNAPYFDDSVQHPLLDDNADDKGSNELTMEEGTDGVFSEFLYIGTSPPEGNDPGDVLITKVNEDKFLGISDTTVNLWADVDSPLDVRLIWVEVKAPNYNPDPGVAQQIVMDTFKKGTTTVDINRYSWADVGGGGDPADLFSTPGTYQIFYFAKDKDTGNVSPLMESRVYKAIDPNSPPYAFNLVSPADGSEVLTTFILDWEDTTDPEGDSFTYTVLISEGDALFTDPIRIEALKYSTCLVVPEDGIKDLTDYFWKVWAIDEYGAYTESGVSQFTTNNTNPTAAWIEGHVYNSITGVPIANAIISVSSLEFNTELNGYYIGTTNPGTYTVSASADGYVQKSYPGVVFPDGGIVTRDFGLEPLPAGPSGAIPAILLLLLGE